MTAHAISSVAPGAARAARQASRADDAEAAGSPFASLIGAAPETRKPAAAAPAKDGDSSSEADAKADISPDAAERPSELPAWLLALRAPPAVADGAAAAPATLVADEGDAVMVARTAPGMTLSGLPADRGLKIRAGDTPPTWTPPVPTADSRAATASALPATDAPPLPTDAPPAFAAVALDATQGAALDAAIGGAAIPEGLVIAPAAAAEHGPAAPLPDGPAVASPTPPDLHTLTDAYGEPLALDGRDAALRLGERLRWLTESGVQEARMQLHPRELGSVDIRIRIEGQGASVWFGADHPAARAALEATLPQLRQQLAAEGLALGQAEVGGQGSSGGERGTGQSSGQGSGRDRTDGRGDRLPDLDHGSRAVASAGSIRGLVDRYA
jgi:flagellar hook-length control protein FliK